VGPVFPPFEIFYPSASDKNVTLAFPSLRLTRRHVGVAKVENLTRIDVTSFCGSPASFMFPLFFPRPMRLTGCLFFSLLFLLKFPTWSLMRPSCRFFLCAMWVHCLPSNDGMTKRPPFLFFPFSVLVLKGTGSSLGVPCFPVRCDESQRSAPS